MNEPVYSKQEKKKKLRHPRLTPGAGFEAAQVSGIRARFRHFWKSLGLGDSR